MGMSTKAILYGHVSVHEVADALQEIYGARDVQVVPAIDNDHYRIRFTENVDNEPDNNRLMHVFENSMCASDNRDVYTGKQTGLILGCSGDSEKIMTAVLHRFGGFLDVNDCDDRDYVPVDAVLSLSEDELRCRRLSRASVAAVQAAAASLTADGIAVNPEELMKHISNAVDECYGKAESAPTP